ncbi:MAG: peptidase inhibitor family I36 protein [Actinomycetota bacterium]
MNASGRIALVVVTLSLMVPATEEPAYAGTEDCPATRFCAWVDTHFRPQGLPYSNAAADEDWPSTIANMDDSHYNHGTAGLAALRTYTGINFSGTVISCLPEGLAAPLVTPDDSGDSHRWSSTACSNPGG